jgi:hypothetical protein
MPSPEPHVASDLGVLRRPSDVTDPVTREDVERALYSLTGWEKPQHLVDQMMDVVDTYVHGVRARVVPVNPTRLPPGHLVIGKCHREHLDEHTCPVTVKRPLVDCTHGCRDAADELSRLGQEMAEPVGVEPLAAATYRDTRALDQVSREVEKAEPAKYVRKTRPVPAFKPEQLLAMSEAEAETLTAAQRGAREVLRQGRMRCTVCNLVKPLVDFYRDTSRLTGRASRCSKCVSVTKKRTRLAPR